MALEKLGAVFNQTNYPLQYTPRKMVFHPKSYLAYIIETDHNSYTDEVKLARKHQMSEASVFLPKLGSFAVFYLGAVRIVRMCCGVFLICNAWSQFACIFLMD